MENNLIRQALNGHTIAVVGLSRDPTKESSLVAAYLQRNGYRIIPINPLAKELLNEKAYPSLLDLSVKIAKTIDVIDVFRPSEETEKIVQEAIHLKEWTQKPYVVWLQLGIENKNAQDLAQKAGLGFIQNKCMKIEHEKLHLRK